MITDIYLVDCENVGYDSLKLGASCEVYYFIPNGISLREPQTNDIIKEVFHNGTKNAMDFIIDSYLGYLICIYGDNVCYHIISGDHGFSVIKDYWCGSGITIIVEVWGGVQKHIIRPKKEFKGPFDFIMGLSEGKRKKVINIYTSWIKTKKKKKSALAGNLHSCLKRELSRGQTMQVCDYLIDQGIEEIV